MARRKKSTRRRSPKTVSLITLAESYGQASILTNGVLGSTPMQFITGATDLGMAPQAVGGGALGYGAASTAMVSVGGGSLSLGDIVSQPEQAFGIMQQNVMNNYIPMAAQSFYLSTGVKIGRRLLRRPINQVNRTVFKQLGLGVRL
mgnify:CR=1 FL=1